jgi:hypothetical protein
MFSFSDSILDKISNASKIANFFVAAAFFRRSAASSTASRRQRLDVTGKK